MTIRGAPSSNCPMAPGTMYPTLSMSRTAKVAPPSKDIAGRFGVQCLPVNCLELTEESITYIIKSILYEFPLREMRCFYPSQLRQQLHQVSIVRHGETRLSGQGLIE